MPINLPPPVAAQIAKQQLENLAAQAQDNTAEQERRQELKERETNARAAAERAAKEILDAADDTGADDELDEIESEEDGGGSDTAPQKPTAPEKGSGKAAAAADKDADALEKAAAEEKNSGKGPSPEAEGKATKGDSVPADLLFAAELAGLSKEEVEFYGSDVGALRKRVMFAMRQPQSPAAPATPAASAPPKEPAKAEVPKEYEGLDEDLRNALIARDQKTAETIASLRSELAGKQQADAQQAAAAREQQARNWVAEKAKVDTTHDFLRESGVAEEIFEDMNFLHALAARKGIQTPTPEKLYEIARNRVLTTHDKIKEVHSRESKEATEERRKNALPAPTSKQMAAGQKGKKSKAEVEASVDRKFGPSMFNAGGY